MKTFQKNKELTVENRQKGFSLVELMVGVVIALIASVAIFQVFSVYETQKQQTSSDSSALQNGTLAQYLLTRELSNAGQGINTNRLSLGSDFSPLYGCRIEQISPVSGNEAIKGVLDNLNKLVDTGLTATSMVVAPLLIKEEIPEKSDDQVTTTKSDAILSLGATTITGGLAPISKIEDNGDYQKVVLGYPKKNGITEFTETGPMGFCTTAANDGYCFEAYLLFGSKTTQNNKEYVCTLTMTPNEKWTTIQQPGGQVRLYKVGLLQAGNHVQIHKHLQSKSNYESNKGYLLNLGRITDKGSGAGSADRTYQIGRTAYAMFTIGKSNPEAGKHQTSNNLLRFDFLRNNEPKYEVIADNIVMMKAIYAVSDEPGRTSDKRQAIKWVKPTGDFSYASLTANNAQARKNLHQIRGIKVALIARAAFPEEHSVGIEKFSLFERELDNQAIEVSLANDDAKKYRYEVFEFVVPLQNAQFGFDQAYASCAQSVDNCKTGAFTFQ